MGAGAGLAAGCGAGSAAGATTAGAASAGAGDCAAGAAVDGGGATLVLPGGAVEAHPMRSATAKLSDRNALTRRLDRTELIVPPTWSHLCLYFGTKYVDVFRVRPLTVARTLIITFRPTVAPLI